MPKRIQLSRRTGWRKPEGAIVVARPSKWGNPWKVGQESAYWTTVGRYSPRRPNPVPLMEAEEVVGVYRGALEYGELRYTPEDVRAELAGHDLACWCPLDQPCHADVLLELANQEKTA